MATQRETTYPPPTTQPAVKTVPPATFARADYVVWQTQNGSTGVPGQFTADGDDDGDVDQDDYDIWSQNFGNSLQLFELTV